MKKNSLLCSICVIMFLVFVSGCTSDSQTPKATNESDAELSGKPSGEPSLEPTSKPTTELTPGPTATAVPVSYLTAVEGAVQVDINNNVEHQTIEGFGAGYTYYSDYAYYAKYKNEIYDLLFKDANLSILRFKNKYMYEPEKEFNPKVEKEYYDEARKRLKKHGLEPKVLMSSWTPAQYVKSSDCLYGTGTLIKDSEGNYDYTLYGDYWYKLVKAYQKKGIPVDFLSIQNECDYVAAYESCTFKFDETPEAASYPKAFLAVYNAIQNLKKVPKMLGPETMSCESSTIELYMKEIIDTCPESLYGICHHLYVGGNKGDAMSFNNNFRSINEAYPDLPKWQTEYYEGDFMDTVQIIQNSMMYENLNAYIFWGGVWMGPVGKDLTNLIGVDSGNTEDEWDHEHGYVIGEKYYSMRHFSEYILPGYKRVDSIVEFEDEDRLNTDQLSCSAYVSPDNQDRMVLVAINDSDKTKKLQFQLNDYTIKKSRVILTDYKGGEDTDDFYTDGGSLDSSNCYELGVHSIITVVIDGAPATPL